MAQVHDFISEALKAGHSMDSIISDLNKSEDKEEQAFAKNWLSNASKPEYAAGGSETSLAKTITPILDLVNEYPKTTLGLIGGVAATTAGVKAYNAYQDRKMKREAHESELEKNRAYAKQVELSSQKQAPTIDDIIDQTKQMNKKMTLEEANARLQGTPEPAPSQMDFLKQRFPDVAAAQGQQVPPPAGVGPQPVAPTLPGAVANAPAGIPQVNPQFAGQPSNVPQATNLPEPTKMPSGMHEATWGSMRNQPLVGNTPPAPPMPGPAPSVTQAVATGGNVNQAIQQSVAQQIDQPQTLRTGSGFPAQQGLAPPVGGVENWRAPRGGNLDLNKLPSDLAFVPGMGPGLNSARQRLGTEGAQDLARQQGMPWGANEPSMARLAEFEANRVGPTLTREQRKAAKAPPLPNTTGIPMKTIAKIGAVMSIADIAKAASEGDFAPAKEAGFDLGTASLLAAAFGGPAAAAIAAGLTSTGAGESKADIRKLEHMFKVGGGRGMMPASSYPEGGLDYNSPRKKK